MTDIPSPRQTANLRTSNDYGRFYGAAYKDPWAPSSILQHPNTVKNKVEPRPGRTNEDYGEFYVDPNLRTNIKSYLGGVWRRGEKPQPYIPSAAHGVKPDWEQERQILRQQPGYRAPIVDGNERPVDPRMSARDGPKFSESRPNPSTVNYSGPIRQSPTHQHPLHSSIDDKRSNPQNLSPRWDFRVDPWKSEYRRHYIPEQMSRQQDLRRLDQMTQRRNIGDGGFDYVQPVPQQP